MTDSELLEITEKAEQGDVYSQFYLGLIYLGNEPERKNFLKAIEWFQKAADQGKEEAKSHLVELKKVLEKEKAAEQGDALAQRELGEMYISGDYLPKNRENAFAWFEKAAKQGDGMAYVYILKAAQNEDLKIQSLVENAARKGEAWAQHIWGNLYLTGKGKPCSPSTAAAWFQKAADQGYSESQYLLGLLYMEGGGVPKDIKKAAELLLIAIEHGHKGAKKFLDTEASSDLKKTAEKLQKKIQEDILKKQEAEKKAVEVKEAEEKKAREKKEAADKKAREEKEAAEIKAREEKEVFEKLEKMVEQGDVNAKYELGLLYFNGKGVTKDIEKASELISKAAEQGNKEAQDYLSTERKNKKAKNISSILIGIILVLYLICSYVFLLDNVIWFKSLLILYVPFTVLMIITAIIFRIKKVSQDVFNGLSVSIGFIYSIAAIVLVLVKGIFSGFWGVVGSIISCLIAATIGCFIGVMFTGNEKKE